MKARTRWELPCGAIVIKYRMTANQYSWLRYEKGQPLEYGDYTSHSSLKDAKIYGDKNERKNRNVG